MSNLPAHNTTAHLFASLHSSSRPPPLFHSSSPASFLANAGTTFQYSNLGPKNPILLGKITNLKSWAVYLLHANASLKTEFSPLRNESRFRSRAILRAWLVVFFFCVRNYQPIASRFFRVRICPVVSGRCRCGVQTCSGGPPCRVATRQPPILWILSSSPFFHRFGVGVGCPDLGHDETQKLVVSLQRARFFVTPKAQDSKTRRT